MNHNFDNAKTQNSIIAKLSSLNHNLKEINIVNCQNINQLELKNYCLQNNIKFSYK